MRLRVHIAPSQITNVLSAEIEKETDRIAGKNKGISADPILLKVYSDRVLPLTLVDTPGMARVRLLWFGLMRAFQVPIGDQPANIEVSIRNLVKEYIFQPSAIILAVQSANQGK